MAEANTEQDLQNDRAFMDLYSRQIGAFGLSAMLKLIKMKVLVVGVRGVGIECAKNTCLAGVHTMTLFDPTPTELRDLGSNFFLTEADVGNPRAQVCAPKVQELNSNVKVRSFDEAELTEEIVKEHDFVVFTRGTLKERIRWDEFCRSNGIAFLSSWTGGAMGSVFVDHGDKHTIVDKDGQNPLVKIIESVEVKEDHLLVRYITPDGQPPGSLPDNEWVEFDEVEGLTKDGELSLNEIGPLQTSHPDGDPVSTIRIALTGRSPWTAGGTITEKKMPKDYSFRSLADNMKAPKGVFMAGDEPGGFVMVDMTFGNAETQMHFALAGVYAFEEAEGRLPTANDEADIAKVLECAKKYQDETKLEQWGEPIVVDEELVKKVARHAEVELQPMCAFLGGIVAQELVKISGKFQPINQFFNYNSFPALPDEIPADCAPIGSRYDDHIAVFGKAFQERLGELNLFMVGCGALGCEFVKNFALNGVCCGPNGNLTITDNDRIEVSNLNRQFLFREENVGQPKSVAAFSRASVMNKDIKIAAKQTLVCPETEDIFNEDFWGKLDLVCNALDNMQARFYVDGQCVFYEKPLLESGTMGTGANVDVVVPHQTRSYSDGGQADEGGGVPMCTLRNFPHLIDHCIEWARAQFEDLFVSPAQAAIKFLDDNKAFIEKTRKEIIQKKDSNKVGKTIAAMAALKTTLEKVAKGPTIEDCVEIALGFFYKMFRDKIMDLITAFPEDAKDKDGGDFWKGHKKFPVAATYDPNNEDHVQFVMSTTNLIASMIKIHPAKHTSELNKADDRWMKEYREPEWLNGIIAGLETPAYVGSKVDDLDENSKPGNVEASDPDEEFNTLEGILKELEGLAGATTSERFEPADFEKDDDDNFHIDFVTACANMRAANYKIPLATRHKCKMIAGRIIPAIATTTASVTGLVMLEMFKVLQKKPVEALRNGNFSLGTNAYMLFEADPPKTDKSKIEITKPDPLEHPDAYDEKGNMTEMYTDPEMCLGFAEWVKFYPDPQTKYDKIWVDGCTYDMTVQQLMDKANAIFSEAGLQVIGVSCPQQKVEVPKSEDNPKGIASSCRQMYNKSIPSTKERLNKPLAPLIKELTTRSESHLTVDDPIDITSRKLYTGVTLSVTDDEFNAVTVPTIVLKFIDYDFVSYPDRKMKEITPWL